MRNQQTIGAAIFGATLALILLIGAAHRLIGPADGSVHGSSAGWGLVIFFGGPIAIWAGARIGVAILRQCEG